MSDFRKQILEDISEYQEKYPNMNHIKDNEWAFNFWVLDKLFSVEEELIEEHITDYNDKGIDCFVWHEDLKDLYLIQNKFYTTTQITKGYILDDFLTRSIGALEKGTYTRSKELQDIYNKFNEDEDFRVHFHIYVTNESPKEKIIQDSIAKFNADNSSRYIAKIFSLKDIHEQYFMAPITDKKSFSFAIRTINRGTILQINNNAYKLTQALDAKYVLTPVMVIYEMYRESIKCGYPLFDENIREYLGNTGNVNKQIIRTLSDKADRKNFFFYNNGITIIVEDMTSDKQDKGMRSFEVTNPQIVNGCQTVNSIYEVLNSLPADTLETEFKETYVMTRFLKIPSRKQSDYQLDTLYKNIVTYNNSQNAINEKTFIASQEVFRRIQREMDWFGFLLCIKQSDKYSFTQMYRKATPLLDKNKEYLELFGLQHLKKTNDFIVPIEKYLQVILSFITTPTNAVQNKGKLLVANSEQNKAVTEFLRNPEVTNKCYLFIYLLYLRAEHEKKINETGNKGKTPNPFFLIYCFAKYECKNDASQIVPILSDKAKLEMIIKTYRFTLKKYYDEWVKENPSKEYNDMIKTPVNIEMLDHCHDDVLSLFEIMGE